MRLSKQRRPPHAPALTPTSTRNTPNAVTLGELSSVLNQSRPHYYWDRANVACAAPTTAQACCPAYCCNVESTAHELQHPIDMSFRKTQTAVSPR